MPISTEQVIEALNAEDLDEIRAGQMLPEAIKLLAEGMMARGGL